MRDYRLYQKAIENGEVYRGCRALYNAFAKYGYDTFKREILVECDINMLNHFEDVFVVLYKTLRPDGYNLITGGGVNRTMCDETRALMAKNIKAGIHRNIESYRDNEELDGMPPYFAWYEKGTMRGFRINKHPLCTNKRFTSRTVSVEILKGQALEFMSTLEKMEVKHLSNQMKKLQTGVPTGIQSRKNGRYEVAFVKKGATYNKFFSTGTSQENLAAAILWMTNTKQQLALQ